MNQILITEKLYVTPELKKKKKFYRIEFFISVFIMCLLFSYYIYAEYDKNRSEQVSKDILANLEIEEPQETNDNTIMQQDGVLVVVLNNDYQISDPETTETPKSNIPSTQIYTTKSGKQYSVIGRVQIPKIEVDYPILSDCDEELLKIAPNKYHGADPNEVGNLCIAGHNYRNKKFFSKVPILENGDIIKITDLSGKNIDYVVYSKYNVHPKDMSCTSQKTNGKKEITLITCNDDSSERVIIKATEVI